MAHQQLAKGGQNNNTDAELDYIPDAFSNSIVQQIYLEVHLSYPFAPLQSVAHVTHFESQRPPYTSVHSLLAMLLHRVYVGLL